MGVLTPDNRQDGVVYQPHLIRYHHSFRSPMNSERMNLEQQIFLYDITKLNEKAFTFEVALNSQLATLFDNSTLLSGYTITWADTTTMNPVYYSNIEDISVVLSSYIKRLETLEQYP